MASGEKGSIPSIFRLYPEVRPRTIEREHHAETYADLVLKACAEEDEVLAILWAEDPPEWNGPLPNPTFIYAPHPVSAPPIEPGTLDERVAQDNKRCKLERERHAKFLLTNRSHAHLLAVTEADIRDEREHVRLLERLRDEKEERERSERTKRELQAQRDQDHAERTQEVFFVKVYCPRGKHSYLGANLTNRRQNCPRCRKETR